MMTFSDRVIMIMTPNLPDFSNLYKFMVTMAGKMPQKIDHIKVICTFRLISGITMKILLDWFLR